MNMGLDYSYTQPSSSDEYDITSLLQEEADLYADEAQSTCNIAGPYHYPPKPEDDDGIPRSCYCGGQPVIETSYTSKHPGRSYRSLT
ncbi:hypothetical protein Bca52824_024813 [Brassica carinata]|uniref:Uncharacterized protein n=1 Tax=Brassica carinata TaxID=52824 RepID=A0A8X7VL31_BRACI|nr:hypothetical protein Bca52824_024813 [Brassica carinata]